MSVTHCVVEGKTGADETLAANAMQALTEAYPGHPWHVDARDGLLILKHMRLSGKWGQIKHTWNIYSASDLKKAAVMLGGEFLERAKKTRGALVEHEWTGRRVVDGIPTKDLLLP